MRPFPPRLEIRPTALGRSVFSLDAVDPGEPVLEFRGGVMAYADFDDAGVFEHSLQIGPDTFLGPSGEADDYVNHSCDPNCGIVALPERVLLVALRPIAPGDEIVYDHSTTMVGRIRRLEGCRCGAARCRGSIGDYDELPCEVRASYERAGVVPRYAVLQAALLAPRPLAADPEEPRIHLV